MIAKITGIVEHIYEDSLIVVTHGLGYQILCTRSVLTNHTIGDSIKLFVCSQIKEQQHVLHFGFLTEAEKSMFLLVQSVSGVGAKMAMTLLSSLSPTDLSFAIASQNKNLLTTIPGVGPKLADRIILELKNKINASAISETNLGNQQNTIMIDAALALSSLGISYSDALEKVRNVQKQLNNSEISLEDLIKSALK